MFGHMLPHAFLSSVGLGRHMAHMDPDRPVYQFISFLYDLYIVFKWFVDDFRWFYVFSDFYICEA